MWLLMLAMTAAAQMVEPVKTSAEMKMLNDTEAELLFHMTIADGWHVYSPKVTGGPIAATFNAEKMTGAKTKGALTWRGKEISKYDNMFQQEVQYFENSVTFVQKVQLTGGAYDIDCYVEYGACNDQMCMPPTEVPLKAKGTAPVPAPKEEKVAEEVSTKEAETTVPTDTTTATDAIATADSAAVINASESTASNLWTPVINELRAKGSQNNVTDHSLLYILLMGFVGGLLAVCMPCIWPIIPMTVSFFLKRAKADKRKGIRDALTYGISIIVIYLALGLIVTAFFGSDQPAAPSSKPGLENSTGTRRWRGRPNRIRRRVRASASNDSLTVHSCRHDIRQGSVDRRHAMKRTWLSPLRRMSWRAKTLPSNTVRAYCDSGYSNARRRPCTDSNFWPGVIRQNVLSTIGHAEPSGPAKLSTGMLKPYSTGPNSFRTSTSIANAARPLASVTASVTFAFGPVLENVTVSPSRHAAYPRPPNVPRL